MGRKKLDIHTFVLRFATVLTVLVLITTSMVTGRYAKYVSSASGSDSARVAKFSVTQHSITQGNNDLTQTVPVPAITPGQSVEISVVVAYDVEVAVKNTITVQNLYQNLPLTIRIDGTERNTYSEECQIGNYSKEYKVEITWPEENNDTRYIGMVDLLEIRVITEQID